MNINIQSVHFSASERLQEFISQKVGKLDLYYDGIISAEVSLKLAKSDDTENKVAEINLNIPGNDLFAKKQCKTFEEAIDLSCEALRKQLLKWKEKINVK
jgi:putative sigma-54 modulation protein